MRLVVRKHGFRALPFLAVALIGIMALAVGLWNVSATPPSTFMESDSSLPGTPDGNVKDTDGSATVAPFDWANNGTGATNTCPALLPPYTTVVNLSGAGGLFNCGQVNGRTTTPLAPVATAMGTPGTACTPGTVCLGDKNDIAQAQFEVDPLGSDVGNPAPDGTACTGSGDPTVYTGAGGEKNGDPLNGKGVETFSYSSVPGKDEITNVYAINRRHESSPGVLDLHEVFFGADRVINNGESHIDFEFLQAGVSLVVTDACSSSNEGHFDGHRSQGDFVVSIEYTRGGSLGGFELNQWHCNADISSSDSKGWVSSGTQADQGTVCDGGAAHYQLIACHALPGAAACPPIDVSALPNSGQIIDAVTAVTNSAGPVDCGGWGCRDGSGNIVPQIDTNELMEGGVNLLSLGFTGCLNTFIPHTRTSQSFTSTLKDFALIPFNTCSSAIAVEKQDTEGNLLEGACFDFSNSPDAVTNPVCDNDGAQDKDSTPGKICIEGVGSGTYGIHEVTAPGGYSLDTVDQEVTVPSPLTTNVSCPNVPADQTKTFVDPLGDLKVTKTDEAGNLLGGATFKIEPNPFYCTSDTPGGTPSPGATADGFVTVQDGATSAVPPAVVDPDGAADGVVSFTGNVCIESYTITETIAPAGYSLDTTNPRSCDVTEDNGQQCTVSGFTTPGVTFVDPLGELTIYKKDSAGTLLAGATFEISPNPFVCHTPGGSDPLSVADNTAPDDDSADGVIHLSDVCIPDTVGNVYTITETQAPTGYSLPADVDQTCEVSDANGQKCTVAGSATPGVTFVDPLGELTIYKQDAAGKALGGATFTITPNVFACHQPSGTDPSPITDNDANDEDKSDGVIKLTGVCIPNTVGNVYTVTETQAPTGYSLPADVDQTCEVSEATGQKCTVAGSATPGVTFVDPLGELTIFKKDTAGNLLAGATFDISPNPFVCHTPGGADPLSVTDNVAPDDAIDDPTTPETEGLGVIHLSDVCIPDTVGNVYTVTETQAPTGYSLPTPVDQTCEVSEATGQKCTVAGSATPGVTFVDPLGDLAIEKIDRNTGALVGGATFKIEPNPFYCTSGTPGGTPTPGADPTGTSFTVTDGQAPNDPDGLDDGDITFTGTVCIGDYTVTETVAPPGGYLIDPATAVQTCQVVEPDQDCGTLTFKDFRGSIIIRKEAKNANTPCVDDDPGCHDLLGGATFQITPDPTDGTHTCPDGSGGTILDCLEVTDNLAGDAFNSADGLICIDNVTVVPGDFTVKESAAPANYAPDTTNPRTGVQAQDNNCAGRGTTATPDVTFVNTPLSEIEVIFRSLAGAGVTDASIVCQHKMDSTFTTVDAFLENLADDPALDDTDETFTGLVPGTYVCTIEIDP